MEWRPGVARPMAVFGQHSILRYLVDRRYALNNNFFNFSCVAGQGHVWQAYVRPSVSFQTLLSSDVTLHMVKSRFLFH